MIGFQGRGKSTLLNYIAQFCIEATQRTLYLFEEGNTNAQTTNDCLVRSHPIIFEGKQLMLMDLEELEGAEMGNDPRKEILQANLAAAILTVASVCC